MVNLEASIKYASENMESWSIGGGSYHGWCCDHDFYKSHEKDIDKLTNKYGFKPVLAHASGKPRKMPNSDKYYTPMTWTKNA